MSDARRQAGLAALARFSTNNVDPPNTLKDSTAVINNQPASTPDITRAGGIHKPTEGVEINSKSRDTSIITKMDTDRGAKSTNKSAGCAIDLTESSDEEIKATECKKRPPIEILDDESLKKQRHSKSAGNSSTTITRSDPTNRGPQIGTSTTKNPSTHELVWQRKWTTPAPSTASSNAVDLKVLSYNVDKDAPHIADRMRAIVDIILYERIDAALLQELTISSLDAVETALEKTHYRLLFDPKLVITYLGLEGGYFNAIVINTATLTVREESKCLYEFPGTCMGRHVLAVDVTTCSGGVARLMTSHLESLADYSDERVKQMDWVFNQMAALSIPSIFGGDTNIRVKELRQTKLSVRGTKPAKHCSPTTIADAWALAGSPMEAKYTWDLKMNDNIPTDPGRPYIPRFQFDKLFISEGLNKSKLTSSASDFHLVGTKRLPCGVFPSDHFGIVANIGIR